MWPIKYREQGPEPKQVTLFLSFDVELGLLCLNLRGKSQAQKCWSHAVESLTSHHYTPGACVEGKWPCWSETLIADYSAGLLGFFFFFLRGSLTGTHDAKARAGAMRNSRKF